MTTLQQIESWHRYGAYLSGITSIAARNKSLSFDRLWLAIQTSGSCGHWSKEAIRNAFNAAR